jgi:hypothetical protein
MIAVILFYFFTQLVECMNWLSMAEFLFEYHKLFRFVRPWFLELPSDSLKEKEVCCIPPCPPVKHLLWGRLRGIELLRLQARTSCVGIRLDSKTRQTDSRLSVKISTKLSRAARPSPFAGPGERDQRQKNMATVKSFSFEDPANIRGSRRPADNDLEEASTRKGGVPDFRLVRVCDCPYIRSECGCYAYPVFLICFQGPGPSKNPLNVFMRCLGDV